MAKFLHIVPGLFEALIGRLNIEDTEMVIAQYNITNRAVGELKPYKGNARTHSKKQIQQIAKSIEKFGFNNPVLVADDDTIIAGHGRVAAAELIGLPEVPTIRLSHLNVADRRAYVLADNKLAENAGWDTELLAFEIQSLLDLDFDLSLTGFESIEIDRVLDDWAEASTTANDLPEDCVPPLSSPIVSKLGDVWHLGQHRLMCGDARNHDHLAVLLAGETVDIIFTDPPYNVRIDGHVCGLGKTHHREFAMASGEMTRSEFVTFLSVTLSNASGACRDGAIAYVCMDWRHIGELLEAGMTAFDEFKNLCVWNKGNGGMGAFYRSKHELIFVFKKGTAKHVNNFGLGEGGRYRTNVWDYPGISSIGSTRSEELAMHPTVKPVELVADALRDCSRRGDIVLDVFGGSGSTLIAAQKCGRKARVIEFDPVYCDTIIRRFTLLTGKQATLVETGASFDDLELQLVRRDRADG